MWFWWMMFAGRGREEVAVCSVVVMLVQAAVMLLTILPTELALKKKFDEGNTPQRKAI